MVDDKFALEKFIKLYSHYFVEVKLHKGEDGETEILGLFDKPRFKRDWIPERFCRRKVRCQRIATFQPATPTPAVAS